MTHPLWLAQNLMTHPFVRAENLVTHPPPICSDPSPHPPILIDQSLKLQDEHFVRLPTLICFLYSRVTQQNRCKFTFINLSQVLNCLNTTLI